MIYLVLSIDRQLFTFNKLQYSSRVLGQKRDRTSALLALYSGESSVAYSMAIA